MRNRIFHLRFSSHLLNMFAHHVWWIVTLFPILKCFDKRQVFERPRYTITAPAEQSWESRLLKSRKSEAEFMSTYCNWVHNINIHHYPRCIIVVVFFYVDIYASCNCECNPCIFICNRIKDIKSTKSYKNAYLIPDASFHENLNSESSNLKNLFLPPTSLWLLFFLLYFSLVTDWIVRVGAYLMLVWKY